MVLVDLVMCRGWFDFSFQICVYIWYTVSPKKTRFSFRVVGFFILKGTHYFDQGIYYKREKIKTINTRTGVRGLKLTEERKDGQKQKKEETPKQVKK